MLFLSSDLAAFVNGVTLVVDGGVNAKFPYLELQQGAMDAQVPGES